jgi:dTDP-4-amino-4,6-dideoxygalactose transaminase
MWNVPLFDLNYDSREELAVCQVLASKWLTMGERTKTFESEFSSLLGGAASCHAVSSATAALHMALLALGVGPGDEVIIPGLTFVADANVVKMVGATPVLADSTSLTDWNISAATIEPKITSKTKAVIAVHFAGYPCDMSNIVKLCRSKNLSVIEDVAHAPGASIDNMMCGTIGDVGCFSFFTNKNLSVGEGGMVVTRDPNTSVALQALRSHGMSSLTLDRHKGRATTYDVGQVGLNYRMDEVRAALGIVQLAKLRDGNLKRLELTGMYRQALDGSEIELAFDHLGLNKNFAYHIMPILLPEHCDRKKVINNLKEKGIQTSIHYPAFWDFTAYKDFTDPADAPNVAEICMRELTLPLYPTMTGDQLHCVVDALLEAVQ